MRTNCKIAAVQTAAQHQLEEDGRTELPRTLGDVLYAGKSPIVSEQDWVGLVHAIAAGDQVALHGLYERAHRVVYTLIMRITCNRETAEELTLDVFFDVWRRAAHYVARNGSVLGWIMNQARSRAIDRLRFEQCKKRVHPYAADPSPVSEACNSLDRRAPGDRGGFLQRIDVCRGGAAAEPAPRHRQDTDPLWIAQASAGDGRRSKEVMSSPVHENRCDQAERVSAYALDALPSSDVTTVEGHLSSCAQCQRELAALRPVVHSFASWPTDVLRPAASLQKRLARRISEETGKDPVLPETRQWSEPEWDYVAPGISCKLLATDTEEHVVSMLVRLAPGGEYPAHTHAGVEELHLLDGELWIDDRKLYPGDYNRAERGSGDKHVWSETGCTCVLITSTKDILR